MATDLRSRVRAFLDEPTTPASWSVRGLLFGLIATTVAIAVRDQLAPGFLAEWQGAFDRLEQATVLIFSAEYALRLWASRSPSRFVVNFYNLVDLIAILPSLIAAANLLPVRALRLIAWSGRLFRGFRLVRPEDEEGEATSLYAHENAMKNLLVITAVIVARPSLVQLVQSEPAENLGTILTAASMFSLAAMFAYFGLSYASADPRSVTDRTLMHLTSGMLLFPVGISFVILQAVLETLLTGPTGLLTLIIWQVYAAVVLFDFWNARQLSVGTVRTG